MIEAAGVSVQGFVKIIDNHTKEVLVDTHNDVLYGNISTAIAYSLIGNPTGILGYMAFGNGGAYVTGAGAIQYKNSYGGVSSIPKLYEANLYNTIYVRKLTNGTSLSIPSDNVATNYEDIVADVTLSYNEPPSFSGTQPIRQSAIEQSMLDNSTFIGTPSTTSGVSNTNSFVFNEIGLFSGTPDIFASDSTETMGEVDTFIKQGYSSNMIDTSKLMLTHVIFHPIQKSANRSLQILYTLRIQMGNSII